MLTYLSVKKGVAECEGLLHMAEVKSSRRLPVSEGTIAIIIDSRGTTVEVPGTASHPLKCVPLAFLSKKENQIWLACLLSGRNAFWDPGLAYVGVFVKLISFFSILL